MNDISLQIILSMISIEIPFIVLKVLLACLQFIYLDLLQTDKWLPQLFYPNYEEDEFDDEGLNIYFQRNGLDSTRFIINSGSSLVYLTLLIGEAILWLLIYLLSFIIPIFVRVELNWQKIFNWNSIFRFIIQQQTPLLISSFIGFLDFRTSPKIEYLNATLSIVISIILPLGMMLIFRILYKHNSESNFSSYQELLQELNHQKSSVGKYWQLLILLRWQFTCIIMVFLRDYPSQQLQSLLLLSYFYSILVITSNPFQTRLDWWLFIFQETGIALYLYVLMGLTPLNENGLFQQELGWFLMSLIFLSVAGGMLKAIISAKELIMKKWHRRQKMSLLRAKIYSIRAKKSKLLSELAEKEPKPRSNILENQQQAYHPDETNQGLSVTAAVDHYQAYIEKYQQRLAAF
ncbi:hypothetical protein FGO68_gene8282 [Halteria grandinella]|uniref:Uncharacterized protein n=1 Tax=Halteria grandinella TaxID=5974 RepID=A0A8J8P6B0_HALGN|nr:hypothetical protein FGO68_gene8282 [Halteria grandinella]